MHAQIQYFTYILVCMYLNYSFTAEWDPTSFKWKYLEATDSNTFWKAPGMIRISSGKIILDVHPIIPQQL